MASLKFKIAFNTVVQFIGRFATSLLGFIITLILARNLDVQSYGSYAKIYTLISFFFLINDFGLNAVYIRKYKRKIEHFPILIYTRIGLFALAAAATVLIFLFTADSIFTPLEKTLTFYFLPSILFFGIFTSMNVIFQINMRYDLSVIAAILGGGLGAVIVYKLISWGVLAGVIGVTIGYAATALAAYFFAKKQCSVFILSRSSKFSVYKNYSFLISALPVGIMLFLNAIYARIDIFIISALKGNSAVAVYQLAYKFFEFPLAFATLFANSIFPHYVEIYSKNKKKFYKIFTRATALLILTSLIFLAGTWIIAQLLYIIKPEYAQSAKPLQILAYSYPIFFTTSAFSWLLFIKHKERWLVYIYSITLTLSLIANIVFIPHYGIIASAWITVVTELAVLILMLFVFLARI